jgi:hypothetical protein
LGMKTFITMKTLPALATASFAALVAVVLS